MRELVRASAPPCLPPTAPCGAAHPPDLPQPPPQLGQETYSTGLFLSNAGSLGPLGPSHALHTAASSADVARFFALNVAAHMWLSSAVSQAFHAETRHGGVIVNVSSLAAVQPVAQWGPYCAAKAARDMAAAVAASESPMGAVEVLNWAPGPMPGAMQTTLAQAGLGSPVLVPMADSAAALGALLFTRSGQAAWASGAHVDVFDSALQGLRVTPALPR